MKEFYRWLRLGALVFIFGAIAVSGMKVAEMVFPASIVKYYVCISEDGKYNCDEYEPIAK